MTGDGSWLPIKFAPDYHHTSRYSPSEPNSLLYQPGELDHHQIIPGLKNSIAQQVNERPHHNGQLVAGIGIFEPLLQNLIVEVIVELSNLASIRVPSMHLKSGDAAVYI